MLNNKRIFSCHRLAGGMAVLILSILPHTTVMAQDDYWHQRVSLFDKLPVTEDDIVFLGNSITMVESSRNFLVWRMCSTVESEVTESLE